MLDTLYPKDEVTQKVHRGAAHPAMRGVAARARPEVRCSLMVQAEAAPTRLNLYTRTRPADVGLTAALTVRFVHQGLPGTRLRRPVLT